MTESSLQTLTGGKELAQMSGSGREAVPDVQEWLGGPPKCAGVVVRPSWVVGRPSWKFESGWDAFPVVREWSGGPPGCPGVV